jgi:hypothetical protein
MNNYSFKRVGGNFLRTVLGPGAGCRLQVTGCRVQGAGCRGQVAGGRGPVAGVQVTGCLVPGRGQVAGGRGAGCRGPGAGCCGARCRLLDAGCRGAGCCGARCRLLDAGCRCAGYRVQGAGAYYHWPVPFRFAAQRIHDWPLTALKKIGNGPTATAIFLLPIQYL